MQKETEIRPLNRGNEGEKVEPVRTHFTDDVISESNAANEGGLGGKKERERRDEGKNIREGMKERK